MKMLIFVVAILSILIISEPTKAYYGEPEYRLNIGLYTEHYINDKAEFNEINRLVQFTRAKDEKMLTAATFINSHYERSYLVGAGIENDYSTNLRFGAYLAAVTGYAGHVTTHVGNILIAPIAYANFHGLSLNVMPAALNVGFEFDF